MGIKERRLREIETLKTNIVAAARQLATQKGWPSVSIRKIGEIIEYTPPVIYEHFKNKEAILAALEALGFQELKVALEEAQLSEKDAKKQLKKISAAYWEFAFDKPELYQAMFNLQGTSSTPPNTQALRESAHCVVENMRYLHTFPAERESLFFQWWALSHGFVSLVMSGQLPNMEYRMRQAYEEAIDRFIKSMS